MNNGKAPVFAPEPFYMTDSIYEEAKKLGPHLFVYYFNFTLFCCFSNLGFKITVARGGTVRLRE